MRTILFTVVAVMALTFTAGVGTAPVRAQTSAVVQQHEQPEVAIHPMYVRTCSWATCTVYFNKGETKTLAAGIGVVWTLCAILKSTPAAIFCAAAGYLLGRAADNALLGHRCAKFSFSRWVPVMPTNFGTYYDWRCH